MLQATVKAPPEASEELDLGGGTPWRLLVSFIGTLHQQPSSIAADLSSRDQRDPR